ncbi:pentapeptide repeat-containing protein [Longitalea luteola]|uniref:pentapeptide repeat-containing protein n=1 Tax=Longitalea luteola TaxID=2812563 RepID=UPI001A96799A|nr:pentapeptide repeat-containing protein [Longitalea luteola]
MESSETSDYGANLSDLDFSGADLTGADLNGAILENASFESAIMHNVSLVRAKCSNTIFRNANLTGADFHKAEIDFADFTIANLTKVDFTIVSSEGIKLKGAIINDIEFEEPFKGVPGPWNVNSYQLAYVEDLFEIKDSGQARVKEYLTNVLTSLGKMNDRDIKDHKAYTDLLEKVQSLLLLYKEEKEPDRDGKIYFRRHRFGCPHRYRLGGVVAATYLFSKKLVR